MMDCPSETASDEPYIAENFRRAKECADSGKNLSKAISLLRRNALLGDTDSMVFLGVLLKDGSTAERQESIRLFKTAADAGNASGLRNLGYCYAVGINIPKDKEAAAICYQQAMELGNAKAACNLGVMYDYGHGVPRDPEAAFQCFTYAAENGNTRGMTNLGEFYNYGKGTEKNLDLAEKWYLESGSPRAHHRLALIYLDEPSKADRSKGLEHLKISADRGYSKAMVRLGDEIGGDEAMELYRKAASKSDKTAVERLKSLGYTLRLRQSDCLRANLASA